MKTAKLETLISSGYAFLKSVSNDVEIYENKFTGLRVMYDFSRNSYKVLGD